MTFYARMAGGIDIMVELSESIDFGVIRNADGAKIIIGDYVTMHQFLKLVEASPELSEYREPAETLG